MATGDIQIFSREHNPRKAIVGDGTGDYVQIDGWGPARQFGGTADTVGTLTAWVNIKSVSDSYSIISAGDTNALEYINLQVVNGLINLSLADGGVLDIDVEADGDILEVDTWTHIACVQDGVQPKLYKNGVLIASTNDDESGITKWFADLNGIDNSNIGILDQSTSTTLDLDGAIGTVKHYNAALTAEEIMNDYNGSGQSKTTKDLLISQWDWDGDFVDSVSGHNGTAVNNIRRDASFSNLTAELQAFAPVVADGISMATSADGRVIHLLHVRA